MPASEQGVSSERYRVIPRVLIFLFDHQQRVLLIKGAKTKRIWADRYNGIGGHVERGEDTFSAAHRELKEETNLNSPDLWLCGTAMIDTGQDTGIVLFIYKGLAFQGNLSASIEGELEWINLARVSELPLVEDLHILLPAVVKQQPGSTPFSARYWYDSSDQLRIELIQ